MNRGIEEGLPHDLKNRLDLIIQTAPLFWEQKHHPHFTNHGPAYSERVHRQKLAQLAQELPEDRRLTSDEIFIVSAAAWLYEIGMQSPNLRPILDFDYRPGDVLSPEQLHAIRDKKHLLTERLIIDSVRSDYQGAPLQLGLIRPADDYTRLIAEVCRWCSNEPLADVPERLPVGGIFVRVRLLVALLRLADQMYIDSSRVNLDLLGRANLPMRQFAKWWVYHYSQTLPIVNGQIRWHYILPVTQKEYVGHLRALVEPNFDYERNEALRYLWEQGLRLIPDQKPTVRFDQPAGFFREIGSDLITYLRRYVVPKEIPEEVSLKPEQASEDRCLLVLDYENFILQLGQEGYSFSHEDISRWVVTLLREANNQHAGPVDGLAVGHWERPDLAEAAKMLKGRVYNLLTVETHEDSAEKLGQDLAQRLRSPNAPKRIILVAPLEVCAPTAKQLVDSKHVVNAWIANLPESDIYRAIVNTPKSLQTLLQLRDSRKMDRTELEVGQAACILRLDDRIADSADGILLSEIIPLLIEIDQVSDRTEWWRLWLLNQKILITNSTSQRPTFTLNPDHPAVTSTRDALKAIVETLFALSSDSQGLLEDRLVSESGRLTSVKSNDIRRVLDLLKNEGITIRDARARLPDSQPTWYLNLSHRTVVDLLAPYYLAQFVVALDHVLVREGHPFIHEHSLKRHLASLLGESLERVYELAQVESWVNCEEPRDPSRYGNRPTRNVSLADDNGDVERALRNRDIILTFLSHKLARNGMTRDALWQSLSKIRAFTLKRNEFDQWLNLLERDSVILRAGNTEDNGGNVVKLAFESQSRLLHRLLGRMNVYGLIRTIRIMGAVGPNQKKPVADLTERVAKFVTNHDKFLAEWTIDYARAIKLITIEETSTASVAYLNIHHGFLRRLDKRQIPTCQALVELVKRLARPGSQGCVPRHIVLQEMETNSQFGFTRGEHEYWLDQSIHRLKLLEEQRSDRDRSPCVRVLQRK